MGSLFQLRWRQRVLALGGILLVLLAGLFVWRLSPRLDPQIERIRQKGYPVTISDFRSRYYSRVSTQTNVASYYTNILSALQASDAHAELQQFGDVERWLPRRGQLLTAEQQLEFRAILNKNSTVLNLLIRAPTSSFCLYPLEFGAGRFFEISDFTRARLAVGVLDAESMLQACATNADSTTTALLAAGRLTDSLGTAPLLVPQLIRFRCWENTVGCLNRVLNRMELGDPQLASLEAMLASSERLSALADCFVGERVMGLSLFSDRRQQALLFAGSATEPSTSDRLRSGLLFSALKTAGLLQKDRLFYLDLMERSIDAAEQPLPRRFELSRRLGPYFSGNRLYFISNLTLPRTDDAFVRDARTFAWTRAARTALAIERFRLQHAGRIPFSLDELVPGLLDAVPSDPFDGKPLRFKQVPRGYVVYSVGMNGVDDGGAEVGQQGGAAAKDDLPFVVER